ncbi:hypothetical protein [Sphingomonas oryzagri]|jgi:hypothetical protein|uniref:SPOR domain-containing protein n=1 Tax=Sphingomonas oryzagri TaxID=3042314 RepID=A0ABT6MYQ1_9SPHN|nr:hypothetical protein [Sphingomonas oryzagri]MDH7638189.1 hypothetical protein [Sphingomonas oryzagri]
MSQEYEDWQVDDRPALKGLAAFVVLLLILVVGTGLFYNRYYAARTRADPVRFPQPELETIDSAPRDRQPVPASRPPAGIDRAMAATAARGDALWND